MAGCGVVNRVFVVGGSCCFLFNANLRFRNRLANRFGLSGHRTVVLLATSCKYFQIAERNRIKNRMEVEKVINAANAAFCFYCLFFIFSAFCDIMHHK